MFKAVGFKTRNITLGNNDFAVWDISPNSTLLGVTDTKINSHFSRSGLIFPQFLIYMYKNFDFFLLCLCLLLYSKRPSRSHGFNAKNGLIKKPPWGEIFARNYFNIAHQTKPPANNGFSQISQPRVGRFSNRFLR